MMSLIVDHLMWGLLGSWCSQQDVLCLLGMCNVRMGDVIVRAQGAEW